MRVLLAMSVLVIAACGRSAPNGVTELVYATPYGPSHPFSRADRAWMEFVEQRSAGELTIRPSWSGTLISADQSMLELRHGVADIGLITPIYARGGAHLIRVQSGFYSGVRSIENQVALYRCMAGAHPQFAAELAGLHVLAVQGGSLPGIITRTNPVRSLADLRGVRLRAPSELLSVLDELGADPVNMPMGDVYSALAKGVLDGVVAPADTFLSLHFAEVAEHFTALAVPRGAYPARAIGERSWNRLSPELRKLLDDASVVWESALARETEAALDAGLEFARRQGVEIHDIAPAEQRQFDAIYRRHAERNAAALARVGVDGTAVLRAAQASIRADGSVSCQGNR